MIMNQNKHLAALPLGGVGLIGSNMMVYDCDGDLIVVDAGVTFPDDTTPGVDVVLPDTRFLRQHAKQIKALFITHAHEDHIGAVGYLWDDFAGATVYASPLSVLVLQGKLDELGIRPAKGQIVTVQPRETYQAGKFAVEYVPVTHSIPESFALAITTHYGTIVHTADYKFDAEAPFRQMTDETRLAEIGKAGVLAVLGDSTNALSEKSAGSEGPVIKHLTKLVQQAEGRVFFAAFASHFGRTFQIALAASKAGRKICFLGRTINKMVSHAKVLGYWPQELTNWVVEPDEAAGLPPEKVFIFASGTQGEGGSSLTRLSQGSDVRGLRLKEGDTVILSSRMIPGNERGIFNVINGLYSLKVNVISEQNDDDIHVSGHGGRPDIARMYKLLNPTYVIPVHGEERHLHGHADLATKLGHTPLAFVSGRKLVLAEDGQKPGFKPYSTQHQYPVGFNYVDGLSILEHDPLVLRERRKLGFEGLVVGALPFRGQKLAGTLSLTTRGVLDEVAQAGILKRAAQKAMQALEAVFPDGRIDDRTRAADVLTQALRRSFKIERGKQPTIVLQWVDVQ